MALKYIRLPFMTIERWLSTSRKHWTTGIYTKEAYDDYDHYSHEYKELQLHLGFMGMVIHRYSPNTLKLKVTLIRWY